MSNKKFSPEQVVAKLRQISGKAEWGLISAPEGGISGVYSLAEGVPILSAAGPTYRHWRFEYLPPAVR